MAPPTLPGIPAANSNPVNPLLAASRARRIKEYPAPTRILFLKNVILLNSSNLMMTPS